MLLEVKDVSKHFALRRRHPLEGRPLLKAVDGVSLGLNRGESVGIVGESGCGKTTLARMAGGLLAPTSGDVLFDGRNLSGCRGRELRRMRKRFQTVFQNPYGSLNPRKPVRKHLEEPLRIHESLTVARRKERIEQVLSKVGLPVEYLNSLPHELSGGQRQRVAIARALILEPDLLICDEVVSALDVSVKGEILNLLSDLREQYNMAMLFISHDLGTVGYVCDRVAVMYLGKIIEHGQTAEVFSNPRHPYTEGLLASVLVAQPSQSMEWLERGVKGEPPSPVNPPSGCAFRTRCELAEEMCTKVTPVLESAGGEGQYVACHVRAPARSLPSSMS